MLPSTEWKICILGRWGYYAKTIRKVVRTYTGEQFSTGTIYKCLRDNGIKIRAYREGTSPEAQHKIKTLGMVIQKKKRTKRRSAKRT